MAHWRLINASVLDGSGAAPFLATIAIDGDRIVAVAPKDTGDPPDDAAAEPGAAVLTGRIVSPSNSRIRLRNRGTKTRPFPRRR